jgi:sugar phosphate isomerase/epimerase
MAGLIIPGGRQVSLQVDSLPVGARAAIERARGLGFDGVGVNAGRGVFRPEAMSRTGVREVRHLLARQGLALSHLAAGAGVALTDPRTAQEAAERTMRALSLARELGARWVTLAAGAVPAREGASWEEAARALHFLGMQAGNLEVGVAVESVPGPLVDLLEAADSDMLSVAYTPGAFVPGGGDMVAAARAVLGRLGLVVVRDVQVGSDGVLEDAAWGEGAVPWGELMEVFRDGEFGGWHVVRRAAGGDSEAEAVKALRFVRSAGLTL